MSFFGFLGGLLKGGLSIATHGLVNLGGAGSQGGGVPSAAALPGVGRMGLAGSGPGFGSMPFFSPTRSSMIAPTGGGGSALIPHFACGVGMHHAKKHGKHFLATKCVRNRHMNVSNPRALRRSIRRLYGAEKMYARLLRVTHPHKLAHGGRVHPKPPRRRRT